MNNINWEKEQEIKQEESSSTSRSKKKNKLFFSILLAALATFCQFFLFWSSGSSIQGKDDFVTILIAKEEIAADKVIQEDDLTFSTIRDTQLAIFCAHLNFKNKIIGARARTSIKKGTPIFFNSLYSYFEEKSLSEKIPSGKRLFILETDLSSVRNIINSKDKVDIIGIMTLPTQGLVTKTLLKSVEVIAVGQSSKKQDGEEESIDKIALYLTPKETEFMLYAQQFGQIKVVLRNPHEKASNDIHESMTLDKFLNEKRIKEIKDNGLYNFKKQ